MHEGRENWWFHQEDSFEPIKGVNWTWETLDQKKSLKDIVSPSREGGCLICLLITLRVYANAIKGGAKWMA